MSGRYMGVLPSGHALYSFFRDRVLNDELEFRCDRPVFDVYALDASAAVFRYKERNTFADFVGKFYGKKWIAGKQEGDRALRERYLHREYQNLSVVRQLGFDSYPHSVARPLAVGPGHDLVLVEQYVDGRALDSYVHDAACGCGRAELFDKLTDLAWFLADLHARSRTSKGASQERGIAYMNGLVEHLRYWEIISPATYDALIELGNRWRESGALNADRTVLTYGDPVFPNFIAHGEHGIAGIDLERLWPGDCAMDLGCIVAELKHLFLLYAHDSWAGEPYISHFYHQYAGFGSASSAEFERLTTRGRFYMACFELRICRNAWLDLGYRRSLVDEAIACMRI